VNLEDLLRETVDRAVREALARHAPGAGRPDPLDYLAPEGIAELLKFEVETVRELLNSKHLPGVKVRGKWRTSRAELAAHLAKLKLEQRGVGPGVPDPDQVGAELARDMRRPKKAG